MTLDVHIIKPIIALRHNYRGDNRMHKLAMWGIKKRTKSKYYHAELILENQWISAHHLYGIRVNNVRKMDHEDWDYIHLDSIAVTKQQYKNIWNYINSQNGKKYDFLGILFNQLIKIGVDNRDEWFCSEIGSKILQLFGYREYMDIIPADMDPGDMYKLALKNGYTIE